MASFYVGRHIAAVLARHNPLLLRAAYLVLFAQIMTVRNFVRLWHLKNGIAQIAVAANYWIIAFFCSLDRQFHL